MKEIKALSAILKEKFDISFNNEALLVEAMTHSSYANEHKEMKGIYNERIEFLGDAVLELNISDWLFRQFPHFKEGQLTKLRAQIVCDTGSINKTGGLVPEFRSDFNRYCRIYSRVANDIDSCV